MEVGIGDIATAIMASVMTAAATISSRALAQARIPGGFEMVAGTALAPYSTQFTAALDWAAVSLTLDRFLAGNPSSLAGHRKFALLNDADPERYFRMVPGD